MLCVKSPCVGIGPIPTIQELEAEEAKSDGAESLFEDDAASHAGK